MLAGAVPVFIGDIFRVPGFTADIFVLNTNMYCCYSLLYPNLWGLLLPYLYRHNWFYTHDSMTQKNQLRSQVGYDRVSYSLEYFFLGTKT